jgi:hypothetical protein
MTTYFFIKKYKNVIEEFSLFHLRILFYLLEFLQSNIKRNFMNTKKNKKIIKNVRSYYEEVR